MGGRGAGGGGKGGGGGGGVSAVNPSGENFGNLHDEWSTNFKNEPFGPFEDLRGEKNPKYYTVRSGGKLVAGASTSTQYGGTFVHSIASHSKGAGARILTQIKGRSTKVRALAATASGRAFFKKQGFKFTPVKGQYNFTWTK